MLRLIAANGSPGAIDVEIAIDEPAIARSRIIEAALGPFDLGTESNPQHHPTPGAEDHFISSSSLELFAGDPDAVDEGGIGFLSNGYIATITQLHVNGVDMVLEGARRARFAIT